MALQYERTIDDLECKLATFVGQDEDSLARKLDSAGMAAYRDLKKQALHFLDDPMDRTLSTFSQAFENRGVPPDEAPGKKLADAMERYRREQLPGSRDTARTSFDDFEELESALREVKIALTVATHWQTRGIEQLAVLREMFENGTAPALNDVYPLHHVTGTRGMCFQKQGDDKKPVHPSCITERGVLEPRHFHTYMNELRSQVDAALANSEARLDLRGEQTRDLPFLYATLNDMIGAEAFGGVRDPDSGYRLADLFNAGRQMSRQLSAYASACRSQILDVDPPAGMSPK